MNSRQEKENVAEKVARGTLASEQVSRTVLDMYKKLGETPRECLERFKREHREYADVPMTYAGRLDPMAEGVLLLLAGDAIKEKEKYLNLKKTYVCEVLWSVETDSLDVLGMITETKNAVPEISDIKKYFKKTVGKCEQKYPAYSSRTVLGKALFQWAREGRLAEIEIPSHKVELLSAEFVSRKEISSDELLQNIESKIALVAGDFRQAESVEKWREVFNKKSQEKYTMDTISLTVSSGFYIRQFVSDLAHAFETSATTFHIIRITIGDFHI